MDFESSHLASELLLDKARDNQKRGGGANKPESYLKASQVAFKTRRFLSCVYRKGDLNLKTTIEKVGLEKHFYGKVGEISADEEITSVSQ